ncbi:unnamed protein product [Calicophoron daubneyi]|uniref:Ataxin-3 homolog n=1 Tax=Calicophoron daubneyi TaxID=300641 RepID=A0AAV2TP50_CALDB
MDSIFHEKQDGSLCAQHCLNALLQGQFFSAIDLAELAKQLDEQERQELGHGSNASHSQNMNETGYFSVQVISKALSIWSLELVPFLRQSPEAEEARLHPENQRAFICNFRDHWFTIRRFGHQWFDLNSTMSKPKLLSTTYLTNYLAQLQQEGHSIFFVVGDLPECEADQILTLSPVDEKAVLASYSRQAQGRKSTRPNPSDQTTQEDEDMELAMAVCEAELDEDNITLQRVLKSSAAEHQEKELEEALRLSAKSAEEDALQRALKLSMFGSGNPQPSTSDAVVCPTTEEIRQKRQRFLDQFKEKN